MCTVLFIPTKDKKVFVSLRDESPIRPRAIAPELYNFQDINYLAPKDAFAGGTWLGVNEFRNVIILLNGGFENHVKNEKYTLSRGIIVKDLLSSSLPVLDWNIMEMDNVEPFTLIIWSENKLFHLVWDGENKHRFRLDESIPHIFSSATLYNKEAKIKREEEFQNWIIMDPPVSKFTVLNFFKSFQDEQNGFLMNRNEVVKTLSYSFLELSDDKHATLDYYDFSKFTHHESSITLKMNAEDCMLPNFNSPKKTA